MSNRQLKLGLVPTGVVQAINLSPTDGQAAFALGALDAWAIYGYAIPFSVAQNGARILKTAKGILSGNYLIGVRRSLLSEEPLKAVVSDS